MTGIWEVIAIGIAISVGAWVVILIVKAIGRRIRECCDQKRVLKYLKDNSQDNNAWKFRSTRAIASYTNLTEDRVRYICNLHKKIRLSTGEKEDMWELR
jgi:uncharacterized protein YaeQ